MLPCRGGEGFLQRLFEPLGYTVSATGHPLDEHFPEWGNSAYFSVKLTVTTTLQALPNHLYVKTHISHFSFYDKYLDLFTTHLRNKYADESS